MAAAIEQYVVSSAAGEGAGRGLVRGCEGVWAGTRRGRNSDGLPPEYAQGIYATPGRHDALIRFSNGVAHLGADATLSNALGLALKVFDIGGTTLVEDEPDAGTFDYNTINMPVFFCNTVAHYLFIQQLFTDAPSYFAKGKAGIHQLLTEYLTGKGTLAEKDWAWDELLAFLGMAQLPPVNVLLSTYWTMGAVRHGDFVAKVRFAPVRTFADAAEHRVVDLASDADAYRRALEVELKQRPFEFDLQVQLCSDLELMPVQDVTVEWLEAYSPFVTVAKVRLPAQDISGADNLERMDALSFTPWRVTAEHAPLGEIQRVRKDGVPALVDRTSSAQPSGATGAAERARGARRGTSHLAKDRLRGARLCDQLSVLACEHHLGVNHVVAAMDHPRFDCERAFGHRLEEGDAKIRGGEGFTRLEHRHRDHAHRVI